MAATKGRASTPTFHFSSCSSCSRPPWLAAPTAVKASRRTTLAYLGQPPPGQPRLGLPKPPAPPQSSTRVQAVARMRSSAAASVSSLGPRLRRPRWRLLWRLLSLQLVPGPLSPSSASLPTHHPTSPCATPPPASHHPARGPGGDRCRPCSCPRRARGIAARCSAAPSAGRGGRTPRGVHVGLESPRDQKAILQTSPSQARRELQIACWA